MGDLAGMLLWAGIVGGVITVLYLIAASLRYCNVDAQQCAAACGHFILLLLGYVYDILSGLGATLYAAYKHLYPAWYVLTGLTIMPLIIMPSKDMAVPFLALYCVVALWLCFSLPSKPKPTKPSSKLDSHFFKEIRI